MIPIRLKLSNFMPYRDNVPALSFTGIHTASICGDNGSGKSSLVDAMTWALWGKTRARSDDDLIHQNANQTQVEFDFAVDKQVYRVIRRHARAKSRRASGPSELQLFVANDGVFKPITGDRMPETEKKIIDILHMDYETFINSAYLRQGHADQFTTAIASKRKDVLASVLGLSIYEKLEAQAKEKAGQRDSQTLELETAIRDIRTELSRKSEYEAEWEQAQNQLADIEKTMDEHEHRLVKLRQDRELLKGKQQQLAQLDMQLANLIRDLNRWQAQAAQHNTRVTEYEKLLVKREEIEEGYARLASARKENEELNQKFRLVTTLNERRHRLDITIMEASQALLKEHTLTESKMNELQAAHDRLPALHGEIQQAQLELGTLAETEETLRKNRQDCQNQLAEIHALESDITRTKQEIQEINEKLQLLSTQVGAKCPLCGRELGTDHLELIREKYSGDKQIISEKVDSTQRVIAVKRTELAHLEKEAAGIESKLNQARAASQSRIGILNRQLTEAEEAGRQLIDLKINLTEIEERLVKKDFAAAEQEDRQHLNVQLTTLDYDADKHEQLRQQLNELEKYEPPKRKLEEAERFIDREREAATGAEQAVRELGDDLESNNRIKTELAGELTGLPALVETLTQAENEYLVMSNSQKQARETVGSVKEKLNRCTQLEFSMAEKEQLLSEVAREQKIYRELVEAFGKNGVQALLIERALPEIEAEANKLLGRMTDNRMHIRFETQRPKKDGGMIETLDINIADELGTRNYEMFSGGEAFRINFAIRIALSKVLARRAGARLPTLIIDEGFGTQDTTGMEKLKEAITSIQDDFEKILVVTHIEDFRDAFPTRIDIVKTGEGSTIEVN